MREQHIVPVPGRKKTTHSVIGPPISPVVDSVSLSLSVSLTGLLFLFISSVSVSAQ